MTCYQAYPYFGSKYCGRTVASMRALAFDTKKRLEVEKVSIEHPAPGCKVTTTLRVFIIDGARMRRRPKVLHEALGFDLC